MKNIFKNKHLKKAKQGQSTDDSNLTVINENTSNSSYEEIINNHSNNYDSTEQYENNFGFASNQKYEAFGAEPTTGYTIPNYEENIIESQDYLKNLVRDPFHRTTSYFRNLFPIFSWIPYYPTQPKWILSDFITGVSVAIVLVPQAMSYAKLAGLAPEYGLYSSFIGLMMYSIFATSKDVSIGPVAVMSLEVSKIINRIQDKYGNEYSASEIATTVALLCGAITLGVGLLKLGFLVELIPLPAVMAFTTGSAFNIITSQLPGLMGYSDLVNTHQAPYLIVIGFLKNLPNTKVDAAFGLVGLFILYLWKYLCQHMIKRNPKKALFWTYVLNIRTAIVIIFSTLISFLIIRHHKSSSPFAITGAVKSGLRNVGKFVPPANLASRIAPDLPVATIVLVLEHISIAKSFGRIHDYKIDPNQEFIAIGVTNLVGTFFSAYPATGSFSRTALASKCGVKTPFASVFAGFCVLIAIYAFTSAFYYIPKATLCAIIIHAVSDLMASYKSTWKMYLIQPLDCGIFLVGVFVSVFASIEYGIYWAMCASCALIIWRMCWTNGSFMGRIKVVELINPKVVQMNLKKYAKSEEGGSNDERENSTQTEKVFFNSGLISVTDSYMSVGSYNKAKEANESTHSIDTNVVSYSYKWVPLPSDRNQSKIHTRYVNSNINVEQPPPGVVVYRMSESFIYPNSSAQTDTILDYIKENICASEQKREVLWNNIGEVKKLNWKWNSDVRSWKPSLKKIFSREHREDDRHDFDIESQNDNQSGNSNDGEEVLKPKLKVLHLDFSQVVAVDATSVQALIDLKRAVSVFTNSEFEMHFSGIINPWVIHGLVNAGFGGKVSSVNDKKREDHVEDNEVEVDIEEDRFNEEENENLERLQSVNDGTDIAKYVSTAFGDDGVLYPVFGTNLPHFHLDIPSYHEYD